MVAMTTNILASPAAYTLLHIGTVLCTAVDDTVLYRINSPAAVLTSPQLFTTPYCPSAPTSALYCIAR